ncbi:MAG: hypothetical protein JSW71_01625 [Gemmatimonadota bacterium]|nr:MAG: hypothetical protein JSW71_01625 [Gemmatimonadota bacterium]
MPFRHHLSALLCIAAVACARGGTASDSAAQSQEAGGVSQSAAQLIGVWDLATDPPQTPPGLRMAFTVDSASGSSYFGRLSLYFAGNAGGNSDEFEPFAGNMGQDGTVEFRVEHSDRSIPGISVVGPLRADTIRVETLVIGPDTLSSPGRRWFLVKR